MVKVILIFCMNNLYWIMKSCRNIICSQKKTITYNLFTLHKTYSLGKPSLIPISRSSNKREPMLWKVLLRELLKFSAQNLIATDWSNYRECRYFLGGLLNPPTTHPPTTDQPNHWPTEYRPTDSIINDSATKLYLNDLTIEKFYGTQTQLGKRCLFE